MSSLPVSQSVLLSLSNLKDTVQQCLEELKEKTDALGNANNHIRELETEVSDLQRRLRAACNENSELQDTIRSLKRRTQNSLPLRSLSLIPFKTSLMSDPPLFPVLSPLQVSGPLDRHDLGLDSTRHSSSSSSSAKNLSSTIADELLSEIDSVKDRRSHTPQFFSATGPTSPSSGEGRQFFRKARSELSYEKFSKFLSVIKELNSRRLSREDAMRAARELFLAENPQLYSEFGRLLDRFDGE
ncbi:hypothetical protein GEMRC1_013968 [Eukaryota sp. GEM-RC1]